MASNTLKTYKTAEEGFNQFPSIYKFEYIWPISVDEIAIFIAVFSMNLGCFCRPFPLRSLQCYGLAKLQLKTTLVRVHMY
jgi:hypothetical protein